MGQAQRMRDVDPKRVQQSSALTVLQSVLATSGEPDAMAETSPELFRQAPGLNLPSSSASAPPPKRPKAEPPASPTLSAPRRAEDDSLASTASRSAGLAEETLANKDQGGDTRGLLLRSAESSSRRKETPLQQHIAPWGKLLSHEGQAMLKTIEHIEAPRHLQFI